MEFSRTERTAVLTLGVAAGFIIGLDQVVTFAGGVISLHLGIELGVLLAIMAGMIVGVFVHEAAHKWVAQSIGYYTHIASYSWGVIVGIALSLFSFGWVQFFTPNTTDLEADPRARVSKHRKYENWKQEAFIATAGILATAVIATLLHAAWVATDQIVFKKLLIGNIWLMVYSLLPFELLTLYSLRLMQKVEQLPQSDGLYLFHYSVFAWVFVAAFVLVLSLLLYFFDNPFISIAFLVAMIASFSTWLHFFKN